MARRTLVSTGPADAAWLRRVRSPWVLLGVPLIAGPSFWLMRPEGSGEAAALPVQAPPAPRTEVVRPKVGGIVRATTQPGSLGPFEWVDLHAKVSGYLKTIAVDIGDVITEGQVLAEIDAPELDHDVTLARAAVDQAAARVSVARAKVVASQADRDAADAAQAQAGAEFDRQTARRILSEKHFERARQLRERQAIEEQLLEDQRQELLAAIASEKAARAAIRTAEAQFAAVAAKVAQADAEVGDAEAASRAAQARLARAQVLVSYTKIVAPFDGIVTRRNYHPAAFIQSADARDPAPLLRVERTDVMRVAVQVPDRDVPWLNVGDPATIHLDGLSGSLHGRVSRLSGAEELTTRTMRTEVDVPNPTGRLKAGMYGKVMIELEPPGPHLTVPTSCVVRTSGPARSIVWVVRDGEAHQTTVTLGDNDGLQVEVREGLDPEDRVILRPSPNLADGAAVATVEANAPGKG